eukprot:758120-Hanusia_phi.AAC.1
MEKVDEEEEKEEEDKDLGWTEKVKTIAQVSSLKRMLEEDAGGTQRSLSSRGEGGETRRKAVRRVQEGLEREGRDELQEKSERQVVGGGSRGKERFRRRRKRRRMGGGEEEEEKKCWVRRTRKESGKEKEGKGGEGRGGEGGREGGEREEGGDEEKEGGERGRRR